jgi:hypothetical protein
MLHSNHIDLRRKLTTEDRDTEHTEKWEQTAAIPSVLSVFSVVYSFFGNSQRRLFKFPSALVLPNSAA